MFGLWQTPEQTKARETKAKEEALLYAARGGNLAAVISSLNDRVNIECYDSNGWTPLHKAAMCDRLEIVRFLLEKGANIEAKSTYLDTPLHYASYNNHVEIVRLLLAYGANVNATTKWNQTPLMLAQEQGHVQVQELLQTAMLAKALREKRILDANSLLQQEAMNVNHQEPDGTTLLHLVLAMQDLKLLETMLENPNLAIDATDSSGRTALAIALATRNIEAAYALLQSNAQLDAVDKAIVAGVLRHAASTNNKEMVAELLKHGVHPATTNENGETALHFAAANGYIAIVQTLLENDESLLGLCDQNDVAMKGHKCIDATNQAGESPIFVAAAVGHADVVEALVQANAKPHRVSNDGSTLLHAAAVGGNPRVLGFVLPLCRDGLETRDEMGRTPLFVAAEKGHVDAVTAFLEAKANIFAINKVDKTTVLMAATTNPNESAVEAILSHLVPTLTLNDASYKALTAHRKELVAAQAYLNQRNAGRQTAFALASGNVLDRLPTQMEIFAAKRLRVDQAMQRKEAALATAISTCDWTTTSALLVDGVPVRTNLDRETLLAAIATEDKPELLHSLVAMAVYTDDVLLLRSGLLATPLCHETLQKALADAVASNKTRIVMDLLRTFPDAVHGTPSKGPSPLHFAAQAGSMALLGMLVSSPRTNIDAVNEEGYTALAVAVQANQVDAALVLLSVGANVSISLPDGSSVLHVAAKLPNDGDDWTLLHATLKAPSLNIDQFDTDGCTVLARAVLAEREDLVVLLVEAGADATLPMRNGQSLSILATAAQRRHQGIATYLNERVYPAAAKVTMAAIVQHEALGKGGNGQVFRATYQGRDVALKAASRSSVYAARAMREEMINTAACRCPHVVPFLAAVDHASNTPRMVVELMDLGDLHVQLAKKREVESVELPFTKMQVAWAIANALQVIHGLGKVHRDVKSLNVFLSSIHGVKLGDFGTTETLRTLMTGDKGTVLWTAPEVFRQRGSTYEEDRAYGTAADIYSFGVVLSELASGNEPYAELTCGVRSITDKVCANDLRPSLGQACPHWLRKLATACWAKEPSRRPTAKQIIKFLAKRLDDPDLDHAFDDDDDDLTPDAMMADTTEKPPADDLFSISEEP
ncbi:TKL protein kinase [Saprolegnia diclina VS20]|uniref:TKL protein kinase n=1 Tax=Saprolegnia diclina (strain VS20) TaxID=1156394 RepID=T0PSM9_SAPDV|nr:TKL protein kinase [Saprolegnia diclina VS20]EQC25271.1 TKL protein kinase [Saprolegnia diclina VS20]|eukprot:XP_008621296.1 TKL protein kinase [Saprolegnia diclina VS20]